MNTLRSRFRPIFLLACTALGLSGCSLLPKPTQDPTRYYVLTGPTAPEINAGLHQGQLNVGVRAVTIAPYLDGKAMIVRRGANEIDYCEYARWAEPLATGINRMLISRLHVSDRVKRVFAQPYPFDVTRDVDVHINVLRCEGAIKEDGSAVVSFRCAIEMVKSSEKDGGEVILREVFEAPEVPWKAGDYAGLAQDLSDAVALLASRVLVALPVE